MDKQLIINEIMREKNFSSDAKFAQFLGIKPTTLSSWRSRNTIDYELILAKCVDIDANWLMTGKGSMLKKDLTHQQHIVHEPESTYNKRHKSIPMLADVATAGFGLESFNKDNILRSYDVHEFRDADFLIVVRGNSMSPRLQNGDIIACRILKEQLYFQWDKVYVLHTRTQGNIVKKLAEDKANADNILCVSENEIPPYSVPRSDIIQVALVLGLIRVE